MPRLLRAITGAESRDLRPATEWDESALLGLPQSQGKIPLQSVSQFGSITTRDTGPMPDEVILPVVIGYNPIPLETPQYEHGSLWRDPDWED